MDLGSSRHVKWTHDALLTANSSHNSEEKMTGQAPDTMSNLEECVKIAEMSSSQLLNNSCLPDPTLYYKHKIAIEGFPKFSKLPAELRSKVWEYAMPPYGIFTALMMGREEPRPQQPPPPAPLAFRVVYRLEPVHRDQQDDELRMRLDTMRAIQRTNSEAAFEVQRAFPTTINCTGGKLRFNAERDILSLSDLQYLFANSFAERFARYSQGAVVFADDWHKVPRHMVFNSSSLWSQLCAVNWWLQRSKNTHRGEPPFPQFVEGLMNFLGDCTALKSFGFMYNQACTDTVLENMDQGDLNQGDLDYHVFRFCYSAPIMNGYFYGAPRRVWFRALKLFVSGFRALEALVHGPRLGQEIPKDWQGMRFGRPELQHLKIQAMLPVGPAFHDRLKSTGDA